MTRKFKINSTINGVQHIQEFYIGSPDREHNPISFQLKALENKFEIVIDDDIIDALTSINNLSRELEIRYDYLLIYILGLINHNSFKED